MRRSSPLSLHLFCFCASLLYPSSGAVAFQAQSPVGDAVGTASGRAQLHAEQVAAARQAAAQGRLREAVWRWRVAEALSSSRLAAQEAGDAVARLRQTANADEAQGDAQALAGHVAAARSAYERALQLDPTLPHARSYMREQVMLDVERDVKRQGGSSPSAAKRRDRSHAASRKARAARRSSH